MAGAERRIRRRLSLEKPPNMSSENTSALRMLAFGSPILSQISLSRSLLRPEIFNRDDVNISATKKSQGVVLERNVTLVNMPNLKENDLPEQILHKELRKAICFSCPGPHAVLFVLDPFHLTHELIDILKLVTHYFGESILKHTLIVLYHDKDLKTLSVEEEVKRDRNFRELADKCGQNYIFFNEEMNRTDGSQTQALFSKIDEMVLEHGIFSNPEYKDADKRIKIEEKFLRKSKEKAINRKMTALENEYSGEELATEKNKYEERVKKECREMAELVVADKLGFTIRLVDYAVAIGKGALTGALLGFALGLGFDGMAVTAAIGAGLGGILGGAVNAALSYMANYFTEVRRETT